MSINNNLVYHQLLEIQPYNKMIKIYLKERTNLLESHAKLIKYYYCKLSDLIDEEWENSPEYYYDLIKDDIRDEEDDREKIRREYTRLLQSIINWHLYGNNPKYNINFILK